MRHLLIFMVLLLTSCGFHLRGSVQMPPELSEMAVRDVALSSEIGPNLRRALKNAGVRVDDSAVMVLTLRTEKYGKRVLSVDTLGRAQEYGLSYTVKFSLKDEKGAVWIPEGSVTQTRDLQFDAAAVLGTANEETLLKTEMRRDAILQIMRQLQYAKEPVKQIEKPVEQPVEKSKPK